MRPKPANHSDAPTKDAPGKVGKSDRGSTGSKLDEFCNDFSKIKVKSGDKGHRSPRLTTSTVSTADNAAAARQSKGCALIADWYRRVR
ncbi:MAG: hypothetical protein IPN95_19295 [Bacteroidetes bacterium]|nr:hypothetical protein [Bacteroidota bacterium]